LVDLHKLHRRLEDLAGKKITQRQMAELLGVSLNYYGRVWNGKRPVKRWLVYAMRYLEHRIEAGDLTL
jgi:transcriptional regulator with XRE-family HTH domain